jgi:hypothetical protein
MREVDGLKLAPIYLASLFYGIQDVVEILRYFVAQNK